MSPRSPRCSEPPMCAAQRNAWPSCSPSPALENLMTTNHELFQRALPLMPGGVNSPVRAFKSVVREAVERAVRNGLSFGTPCAAEVSMAETITRLVPSVEMVRMVNSGTEATMSAIRLARGATGRSKIVKFEGCYHGHGDSFLVKAGSGALTFGVPTSPGVPAGNADLTLTLPYNDLDAAMALFAEQGHELAALIIEPVAGNMNCIPPVDGYLQGLRELCTKSGAVLIFDEVMTGFRVALGGAQAHYGVKPDLTTFGKIIGGGIPVAMAAGLAMLELIQTPGFHDRLASHTRLLTEGLQSVADGEGIAFSTHCVGGMFGLFFSCEKVTSYAQTTAADTAQFNRFFHGMLERGVYLAPSAFEAGFMSAAHTDSDIALTLDAARGAMRAANAD